MIKILYKSFAFTGTITSLFLTTFTPLVATAQTNGNVGINIPIAQADKAAAYWTPQRMREAKPVNINRTTLPQPTSQVERSPSGPPVSAPSGGPISSQLERLSEQLSNNSLITSVPFAASYPFAYSRSFVNLNRYTQYPETTIGKVFFTENGVDKVCSASAVNSTNKRLVWTAGHCVSDGKGRFHTNVTFVPAYKPGTPVPAPYGTWSSCGLYARSGWHNNSNFAQDLGAIQACDKGNRRLHNVVGFLGFLANAPRNQFWHAFGYPAAAPFDGRRMIVCAAPYAVNDSGNPNPIGIGCDMTGGASGGPWLVKYSPNRFGAINQINGLNSYKYNHQPGAMYSPYFGSSFLSLRNYAIQRGS
ncbi:hypothetical protein [Gloeocapsopsis sp. IPPAS B-1203]|uniref:trypsin-like serine peptidase n=1 Tax=Gloeocapsopsis sp. IPPAS B-1203 TaxID=2049454 RepID=UPI000C19F5CA|nr:hypothetical protein [Gloeocapsopsis sp. IPPAS B-1203]PIG90676.1 hypothetical protein CSQ79_25265 [Gloeocapsopsis sp. IPPAS B-1203]